MLGELIECFVLVLAWRGVGNAFDRYIFQKEIGNSVICSFTVSHLVFLLIAFTEYKLVERTLRMSTIPRLIIENFFNLIMFLSCVLIWKFYWDLIDNYLLSENYELLVFSVGHFATFVVSILFNVTFLLAGPGTSIMDGEQTKRETNIYFKINYLSAMFKVSAQFPPNLNLLPSNSSNLSFRSELNVDRDVKRGMRAFKSTWSKQP